MAFSTHCLKKPRSKSPAWRGYARWWCGWILSWCCSGWGYAQQNAEVTALRLERTDAGVFLSAALQWDLPPLAEDALHKGIPLFFVTEVEVQRERWYWYPQTVAAAARYLRLSYQPLTRRWRLAVSATPMHTNGLGVVLGQNYDALADALSAMQRIAQWKIADQNTTEIGVNYQVHLRFRLDMSQLPHTLQIGAMGRSGWSLSLVHSQRWLVEAAL